MNFLKYRASKLRKELDAEHPRREQIERIEADLAAADEARSHLIRANMRLVVSVAKKFAESINQLPELVSDGNLSLMRAVEKFDVDRGFKFSTYATYAIRRNFFRTIIQARKDRQRFVTGGEDVFSTAGDKSTVAYPTLTQLDQLKRWIGGLLESLNPRERAIISMRFGLASSDEPQTLLEIADTMGICKERVRQLQTRAMGKLQKAAEGNRLPIAELLEL